MSDCPARRTLRAVSVSLSVLVLPSTPALATGPCFWISLPPFGLPTFICPGQFVKITVDPPCLEPIDEQDVVLCPPGGQVDPTEPFTVVVTPDPAGTAAYGVAIGIQHPDPSDPTSVNPIEFDDFGWTMHLVRADEWDTGDFAFANGGVWTVPPGLGTFSDHFGPDADYAIVFYAEDPGAGPLDPGQTLTFDVHGLEAAPFPVMLLGDGAVIFTGSAFSWSAPVGADPRVDAAPWGRIKASYR